MYDAEREMLQLANERDVVEEMLEGAEVKYKIARWDVEDLEKDLREWDLEVEKRWWGYKGEGGERGKEGGRVTGRGRTVTGREMGRTGRNKGR